jgi:hypothetical protein
MDQRWPTLLAHSHKTLVLELNISLLVQGLYQMTLTGSTHHMQEEPSQTTTELYNLIAAVLKFVESNRAHMPFEFERIDRRLETITDGRLSLDLVVSP